MLKWDKLLSRSCSLSKDFRFDELRKVLDRYGYEMNVPRSESSHCKKKDGMIYWKKTKERGEGVGA